MEEHLEVCPGFTPEARCHYSEASRKMSEKQKRHDMYDHISSIPSSKILKVTSADPT
jgi:hypothetical protein